MTCASFPLIVAAAAVLGAAAVARAQTRLPIIDPGPIFIPAMADLTPILPDEAHVFGFIAETLHLGHAGDSDLIRRLQMESSVDHLHDYRGEAIFAVKPELLSPEGASRVSAPDGNYPFFVFRQSEHGWLLLGQMQGRGYEWSTQSRHLVFNMTVLGMRGATTLTRYEVNRDYLVDLTALARAERRDEKIVPDLQHAF
jgi:hypothetical protein